MGQLKLTEVGSEWVLLPEWGRLWFPHAKVWNSLMWGLVEGPDGHETVLRFLIHCFWSREPVGSAENSQRLAEGFGSAQNSQRLTRNGISDTPPLFCLYKSLVRVRAWKV